MMHSSPRLSFLLLSLSALFLAACAAETPPPIITPEPSRAAATHLREMPPTYTPTSSPTPVPPSATPVPSLTPTPVPTIAAEQIKPFVKGPSIGGFTWSPDSRWLPYADFKALTLHFYDAAKASTCNFPALLPNPVPRQPLAWLPDGRVVVRTADKALSGRPCGKFTPATARETQALERQDPAYSPDGRYQAVAPPYKGTDPNVNAVIDLKDTTTGKTVVEVTFYDLPRGGSSLAGYWLDATHFLIPATADQGPLLLTPGKPVVKIASDFFHLPLKPSSGKYDYWLARVAVTSKPARFHLMLIGVTSQAVTNPLQIYHSETGEVEALPYQASQGAFSNDGHWLLVGESTSQSPGNTLIRPLDPLGSTFETFTDQSDMFFTWSADGSKVIGMSNMASNQSFLLLYSSPKKTFLTAWQAPDYQLYPNWSPDGKYVAVTARSYADYNQQALFVIRVP